LAVSCRYREWSGGKLEICVQRAETAVDAPLVVVVPPGSFASSSSGSQDLGLLRAPVVLLRKGEARARVMVPIGCASFDRMGPSADEEYALTRFERGSAIDKLMCQ